MFYEIESRDGTTRRDILYNADGTVADQAPEVLPSYVAMARRTAQRAHTTGRLNDAQLAAVLETLEQS